jgi:hypothetical protein
MHDQCCAVPVSERAAHCEKISVFLYLQPATCFMLGSVRAIAAVTYRHGRVVPRFSVRVQSALCASTAGDGRLSLTPLTEEDHRTIEERQLGHPMSNVLGVGRRCKHGYPQAFAFDPIERGSSNNSSRRSRVESGLFRLSCPLLVKAIDEWEGEGAVKRINAELHESEGYAAELVGLLDEAHTGHAAARHALIGDRLPRVLAEAAEQGEHRRRVVEHILGSGIAGQTRSKLDIKCIHAQIGDHLCRSESNGLAANLLERLQARGVAVRGDDECCVQCDVCVPEATAREKWWYEPNKNKWKLRKRMQRRSEQRQRKQLQAEQSAKTVGAPAAT